MVSFEQPMWHKPIGRALRPDLIRGLAKSQRLRLREYIGNQHVVMSAQRVERPGESDEIAGYETRTLMHQLIERMLAVGTRLSPKNWSSIVIDLHAIERDVLAVALHGELLEIGRKPLQILLIWQHRDSLSAEETVVPDAD